MNILLMFKEFHQLPPFFFNMTSTRGRGSKNKDATEQADAAVGANAAVDTGPPGCARARSNSTAQPARAAELPESAPGLEAAQSGSSIQESAAQGSEHQPAAVPSQTGLGGSGDDALVAALEVDEPTATAAVAAAATTEAQEEGEDQTSIPAADATVIIDAVADATPAAKESGIDEHTILPSGGPAAAAHAEAETTHPAWCNQDGAANWLWFTSDRDSYDEATHMIGNSAR